MSAFWKKDKKDSQDKETSVKRGGAVSVDEKENKTKKDSQLAKKVVKKKKNNKKDEKDKGLVVPEERATLINKVLIKPMISEAVMKAQELGKYTFKVRKAVTKKEIALAVESLYKVTVRKVNIINYGPQNKMFRGKKGNTKGYKKAIVSLKEGDKIKLF